MAQRVYLVKIRFQEDVEAYPFATRDDADEWVAWLLADDGLQGLHEEGMLEFDRSGVLMGRNANDDRFWARILKELEDEDEG